MELDKLILKTFDCREDFSFPIVSQEDAKEFVKALVEQGVSDECLCVEVEEEEKMLVWWKNGVARSGVGRKVIRRINKPLEEYLWSGEEREELRRNLHKEVERIKDAKSCRLKVQRRIKKAKNGSLKRRPLESTWVKEKEKKEVGKIERTEEGKDHKSESANGGVYRRSYERSWSVGDGEGGEDFKSIRLKKVGRSDLYEEREVEEASGMSKSEASSDVLKGQVSDRNDEDEDKKSCVTIKELIANFNQGISELACTTAVSENDVFESDECCSTSDSLCQSGEKGGGVEQEMENNEESEDKQSSHSGCCIISSIKEKERKKEEGEEEGRDERLEESVIEERGRRTDDCLAGYETTSTDEVAALDENIAAASNECADKYLYVFTDSNSCNSSPIRKHCFKIGLTECPHQELQRASEFNLDIKLVSAIAVCRPVQVMEVLQGDMEAFQMQGKDNWFYCSLETIIQSTTEAISRSTF